MVEKKIGQQNILPLILCIKSQNNVEYTAINDCGEEIHNECTYRYDSCAYINNVFLGELYYIYMYGYMYVRKGKKNKNKNYPEVAFCHIWVLRFLQNTDTYCLSKLLSHFVRIAL